MHSQPTEAPPPVKPKGRKKSPPAPAHPRIPVLLPEWQVKRLGQIAEIVDWNHGIVGMFEEFLAMHTVLPAGEVGYFYIDGTTHSAAALKRIRPKLLKLGAEWEIEGEPAPGEPNVYTELEERSLDTGIPVLELLALCLRAGLDVFNTTGIVVKAKNAGGGQ